MEKQRKESAKICACFASSREMPLRNARGYKFTRVEFDEREAGSLFLRLQMEVKICFVFVAGKKGVIRLRCKRATKPFKWMTRGVQLAFELRNSPESQRSAMRNAKKREC